MTDAVARLTKLADDYASRGDFATEDDIRTLLAAYADAARDRERIDWLSGPTDTSMFNRLGAVHNALGNPDYDLRSAIDAARTREAR